MAYKDGQVVGDAVVRTSGLPAQPKLTQDRTILRADGDDLGYIVVEALDAKGTPNALADNLIEFEVSGPAQIVGVGNGNPLSVKPFQADCRTLFYGKAILIVRTWAGARGRFMLGRTQKVLSLQVLNW